MATATAMASLWSRCFFLWCFVFLECLPLISCRVPELLVTCRDTKDLKGLGFDSGLVISQLPERIPIYPNKDERCDMLVSIPTGYEMMFYFDWLDLYSSDRTRCDSTNVEFFDGSDSVAVKGLEQPVCGRMEEMPTSVYFVVNRYLLIRANSNGVVQGTGFRIHFTIYRRAFPCSREEFACESQGQYYSSSNSISGGTDNSGATLGARRCIANELVCDDWNDCGDWVDEEQNCNTLSAGAITAIVLVAVGLILLIVGLIIFCKIRRQRELKLLSEKEAAVMRDTSFSSSRGFTSPFSISSETIEKEKYIPRYNAGRNSARRSQNNARSTDYEERPPPYTEKPSISDSRSEDDDPPRSRRNRSRDADEVFDEEEEEEAPRMRRGKSQDDRYPPRDDRYPSRRDDRDSSRTEQHPLDQNDRYPDRDERYPSRRDDRDRPPSRHDQRDRDRDRERPPSRHDDRDRERPPSRHNDRDRERERPPSRHEDRDRDRERPSGRPDERDRNDRDSRRDRPRSQHDPPDNRYSSGPEDDMMDQLHPLREIKRRSVHTDSDPDTSREDRRTPQRDRSREDLREHRPRDSDSRYPPRDDRDRRDDPYAPRGRDNRPSSRDRDRDERPRDRGDRENRPRDRDDRPRDSRPRDRDDRPRDSDGRGPRRDDRPDRQRDGPPRSRREPSSRGADDNYEDVNFPPPPPPLAEAEADDSPPRNRRRRSRSRDGQDRPRSNRPPNEGREEGQGRPGASQGGFREMSV